MTSFTYNKQSSMSVTMSFLNTLSYRSLLLLRVALESPDDVTNIEQDITDLYLFPERLELSYKDEWLAYIKRALAHINISQDELQAIMNNDSSQNIDAAKHFNQLITEADPKYQRLVYVLIEVEQLNSSSNISPLKTPLHRWLEWVIS
jgi:hypothetical protein